jgi:hypothetical protein
MPCHMRAYRVLIIFFENSLPSASFLTLSKAGKYVAPFLALPSVTAQALSKEIFF